MPLVKPKKSRRFLDQMLKKHDRLMNKAVGAYTRKVEKKQPIHPEYAASLLDQVAAEDAVFTADTGMCNVWTARYINPLGTRRLIGSYLHGSMANALPHAIGAQLAYPGRQVISVSGDGGLSMLLGELHHGGRAPAAGQRGGVQQLHAGHGQARDAGGRAARLRRGRARTPITRPSPGPWVSTPCGSPIPREIEDAYREAFAHPGPSLVELITDPKALSLPPKITGAQVLGFATAMSKVVLNRGAGEAVSMARSNLRNIPRG